MNSLEILDNYIQRQRVLLERIKLDINNFKELKSSAEKDPQRHLNRIVHEYNQDECPERVNDLVEDVRNGEEEENITDTIDWKLFEGLGELCALYLHVLLMLCRYVFYLRACGQGTLCPSRGYVSSLALSPITHSKRLKASSNPIRTIKFMRVRNDGACSRC